MGRRAEGGVENARGANFKHNVRTSANAARKNACATECQQTPRAKRHKRHMKQRDTKCHETQSEESTKCQAQSAATPND